MGRVLWSCVFLVALSYVQSDGIVVQTPQGEVEGIEVQCTDGKLARAFLGIPYAEPPTGDRRFKKPEPKAHWEAKLEAKTKPHSCPQIHLPGVDSNTDLGWMIDHGEESEDCLYLNVWTPNPKPDHAAVVVFVHGGLFMSTGSSAIEKYDGRELAEEEGVVVVTFNYRLGALGHLYMKDSEDGNAPGNMALRDQELAFKWVHDNIASFGGDPNKVTAMGESSGAMSVGLLLFAPSGRKLFNQLILMNGSPVSAYVTKGKSEALKATDEFVSNIGCASSSHDHAKVVACLHEKSVEEIINSSRALAHHQTYFTPTYEGKYFPKHPRVLLSQGAFDHEVDVILGISKDRGALGTMLVSGLKPVEDSTIDATQFNLVVRALTGGPDFVDRVVALHYTDWEHPNCPEGIRKKAIKMATDSFFVCPTNLLADSLIASGNRVYLYRFQHHASKSKFPEWAGALIGEDVDFVLGHATTHNGYTASEQTFGHHIMDHIGNFIKHGDPNDDHHGANQSNQHNDHHGAHHGGHHGHWPFYTWREKQALDISEKHFLDEKPGSKIKHHLRAKECAFWQNSFSEAKRAAVALEKGKCH